ncbi:helix-turn-helix domain-containing protein [Pseudanabaena mucicola]|jgi:HTH-type transcriptional regulator/antitoxin HigA|uniref:helix-turn-helix domain-containing protein n=1 Tax=Pseudanabaena mucicola TaxID=71190 RepID=UPI000E95DDC7|nr:transcriptional regulator [Pseudanabaena mucicola]HBC42447.1 transcriptional regulator [Pseudanabaena sp.]
MKTIQKNKKSYIDLLTEFPPRPIYSEQDLDAVQKVVDDLIDRGNLSDDEKDYMNVLCTLVEQYEQIHHPIPDIYGVELIEALLEEFDLKQKDLVPIFKTESIVSAVLNGHRKLMTEHIEKLAGFFHVSPAVFFSNHQN